MTTAFYSNGWQGFRIFSSWVAYGGLPNSVRANTKTHARHHDHYRDVVGGKLIIETLQDAMRFLLDCDPRIGRLALGGEPAELPLEGFPLPVESAHGYERPHPYLPSVYTLNRELRANLEAEAPTGTVRRVEHLLTNVNGQIAALCGYTTLDYGGHSFTDTPTQVVADIELHNYRYVVALATGDAPLSVVDGDLVVIGQALPTIALAPTRAESPSPETWRGWFSSAQTDARFWATQRRAK